MAKTDRGTYSEIPSTKISCENFCNLEPIENRYAVKMELESPNKPPFTTNLKCKQGQDDCPMLLIYGLRF